MENSEGFGAGVFAGFMLFAMLMGIISGIGQLTNDKEKEEFRNLIKQKEVIKELPVGSHEIHLINCKERLIKKGKLLYRLPGNQECPCPPPDMTVIAKIEYIYGSNNKNVYRKYTCHY